MRKGLVIFLVLVATLLSAQVKDRGAYRQPIPPTGNADLRWLDAALYDSGFIFDVYVREAYFEHCMRLVAPQLHFSEITWDWLNANPAVLNATFAYSYPPNPNIIHNFVKFAKLVGPVYAKKYEQLLIAYAVANSKTKLLDSSLKADRYGSFTTRNFTWDPKRKAEIENRVKAQSGWAYNSDTSVPSDASLASDTDGKPFADEVARQARAQTLHNAFDLAGDDEAKRVVQWLKGAGSRTQIFEIMRLTPEKFAAKTGISLAGGRAPEKLPWDKIAHAAHRYPPRMMGTAVENLCLHIMRYEEKGAENSKLFPLSKAPWPLLLLLTENDPIDESTYFWNMYKAKGSVPGYARYSFDYTKDEYRYKNDVWHPDSTPRMLSDGGVCGRLSTMAEFAQRSIGTPARGMGQPGHRAFITYDYADGRYFTTRHHSVNTVDVSTVGWSLPPLYGPVLNSTTKETNFNLMIGRDFDNNVRWHIGLCEAMNIGLPSWEDTRMAMHILDIYTTDIENPALRASTAQQEALLRSCMLRNIANTDVLFRLAQLRKGNASRILDLIQAFGNYFVSVQDGCTGDKPLALNTDFGNTTAGADLTSLMRSNFSNSGARNQKKLSNEWALFVRNAIFIGAFTNIPDETAPQFVNDRLAWVSAKNAYAKAVADELKYQKQLGNSPFLAEIQRLNDKYDKVRLAAERSTTRNLKEVYRQKESEENFW